MTEKKPARKKSAKKPKRKPGQGMKGNKFYLLRLKNGKDKKYPTPDDLWSACCKYFAYAQKNPLREQKVFCNMGLVTKTWVTKIRAMTLAGLYIHLGISETTFLRYRKLKGYCWVTEAVDKIVYAQKFEGAAAGLLNANIIARDLGLKEGHEHSGPEGGPIATASLSTEEYKKARTKMIEDDDC